VGVFMSVCVRVSVWFFVCVSGCVWCVCFGVCVWCVCEWMYGGVSVCIFFGILCVYL